MAVAAAALGSTEEDLALERPGGLPLDLWSLIYRYLPAEDLQRARSVCRGFRQLDLVAIHMGVLLQSSAISTRESLGPAERRRKVFSIEPVRGDARFLVDRGLHSLHLHSSHSKIEVWSGTQVPKAHRAFRTGNLIRILLCHSQELWDGAPIPEDYDPFAKVAAKTQRITCIERTLDLATNQLSEPLQYGPVWESNPGRVDVDGVGDWAIIADEAARRASVYQRSNPAAPRHSISFSADPDSLYSFGLVGAIAEPFGFAYLDQRAIKVWRSSTQEIDLLGSDRQAPNTGPDCWTLSSRTPEARSSIIWNGERKWLSDELIQQSDYVIPLQSPGSFVVQGGMWMRGYRAGVQTWQIDWEWSEYGRAIFSPIAAGNSELLLLRDTYHGEYGDECVLRLIDPVQGKIRRITLGWCSSDSLPVVDASGLCLADMRRAAGGSLLRTLHLFRLDDTEPARATIARDESAASGSS